MQRERTRAWKKERVGLWATFKLNMQIFSAAATAAASPWVGAHSTLFFGFLMATEFLGKKALMVGKVKGLFFITCTPTLKYDKSIATIAV